MSSSRIRPFSTPRPPALSPGAAAARPLAKRPLTKRQVSQPPLLRPRISYPARFRHALHALWRPLARRAVRPAPARPDSLCQNGASDAHWLTGQLLRPGFKPQAFLSFAYQSAVAADCPNREAHAYHGAFARAFAGELKNADDRQIQLLANRLDGKNMRAIRAGLAHARSGQPDAVAADLTALDQNLAMMAGAAKREMRRRWPDEPPYAAPAPKPASGKTAALTRNITRAVSARQTSSAGDVPPSVHRFIADDLAHLSASAGQKRANREAQNPNSPLLDVPDIFIADFMRQDIIAETESGASQLLRRQTDASAPPEREKISQTMLDYCRGNAGQCHRLTRLLTQEAIFPFASTVMNGHLSASPYAGKDLAALLASDKHRYHLQRQPNGDINVRFEQEYKLQAMTTSAGEMLPLDNRKSALTLTAQFTVPAAEAPPRLGRVDYASHLVAGQTSGLDAPAGDPVR